MSEGLLPAYFRGFLVVKRVQVGSVVVRSSGSRVSWVQVQTLAMLWSLFLSARRDNRMSYLRLLGGLGRIVDVT